MRSIAFVTGAAGGIGQAIVRKLGRDQYAVAVHDIDRDQCEAVTADLCAGGIDARSYVGDVSNPEVMRNLVQEVEADFGAIDVLVNNAGIGGDRGEINSTTRDVVDRMLAVHVVGPIFLTQAVVEGMKVRRRGSIIMMSSMRGVAGVPYGVAYNAAKGAIISVTKGWAKEFAPWGIRVNAVAPGYVRTKMANADSPEVRASKVSFVPLKREAMPEEVASCVAFLAGKDSAYVTGQILGVNGGLVI